jgi:putative PIN family toxin of toxin-antitoxin system
MRIAGRPRVVFDCNVLLQAAANEDGPAGKALGLLERNAIEVYLSRAVLRELRAVLKYPTVRAKFPSLTDERIDTFLTQLIFRARVQSTIRHVFDYPRATQDEPYVDLAAAAKADFLVSRDKDLLSLATDHTIIAKQFRRQFRRLRVLDPVAFLASVSELHRAM